MGTLMLVIGGLIGAGSAVKKSFTSCWIFLIDLTFAIYVSVFLAPLAVTLLEIPGLEAGYKNAIALGGIFIIADIVLQKISEQIIPNGENEELPSFSKILSAAAGFFSGIIIAAIVMYCFMQTPFVNGLSRKKELRATSRRTLMGVVHTVNFFSFQSLTPEAESDLQALHLLPRGKKTPAEKPGNGKQKESKDTSGPENKTATGVPKKNSADSSAKQTTKTVNAREADRDDDF